MPDKYGTGFDTIYCYPNSEVLRNILGIQDQELLSSAEVEFSQFRMAHYEYPSLREFSLST